jgi:PAS domain S-box-containing protein
MGEHNNKGRKSMGIPLKTLIIEDSEDDALLVVRALQQGGYDPAYERVDTAGAMSKALEREAWDIIVSDYSMPHFSGLAALALYKEKGLDTPFIVVSGTIGEETAAATMVSGANDYVMKKNLSRLIPAVRRELKEAESRRERKRGEEALKSSEQKYRNIFENVVEGIFQTTSEGRFLTANPSLAHISGYSSPEELIEAITDIKRQVFRNPDGRDEFLRTLQEKGIIKDFEVQLNKKGGGTFWASINARAIKDEAGKVHHYEGTMEDITSRKDVENELKQTLERLRKSLIGTIQAMSLMVETRDPYTAGHQKRVSRLARAIAQEMALPNNVVDIIRMGGIIHDIGKISIPAEILSKPTNLTDVEFSLIKVHSQAGYDVLKDVGLPYPAAEMVLQHHERLDGSGYPLGLKNGEILLEAQIIAVADVVEATSSSRPYRPARGIDVALKEIEKNRGVLYNSEVVEACLKLFREQGFKFE